MVRCSTWRGSRQETQAPLWWAIMVLCGAALDEQWPSVRVLAYMGVVQYGQSNLVTDSDLFGNKRRPSLHV